MFAFTVPGKLRHRCPWYECFIRGPWLWIQHGRSTKKHVFHSFLKGLAHGHSVNSCQSWIAGIVVGYQNTDCMMLPKKLRASRMLKVAGETRHGEKGAQEHSGSLWAEVGGLEGLQAELWRCDDSVTVIGTWKQPHSSSSRVAWTMILFKSLGFDLSIDKWSRTPAMNTRHVSVACTANFPDGSMS